MKIKFSSKYILLLFLILFELLNLYCVGIKKNDQPLLHVLNTQDEIFSFANLPNGYLASASYLGLIEIWNVEEGFLIRTLKSLTHFTNSSQLKLVQDRFLAIATTDGRIEIWNANEGYLLKSIKVTDEDDIYALASFKNSTLVVATWDGILILDPFSEEKVTISTFKASSLVVLNNNLLATVSGLYNFISIFNITTGNVVRSLSLGGHTETVSMVILLPNGFLASGSFDNTVKIWDPYKGILIKTLEGHESAVWSLVVTKNGLLASAGDNSLIKLWNPNNVFELKLVYIDNLIDRLTVVSNGYLVGSLSFFKKMFIWDLEKFKYNETKTSVTDSGNYEFFFKFIYSIVYLLKHSLFIINVNSKIFFYYS